MGETYADFRHSGQEGPNSTDENETPPCIGNPHFLTSTPQMIFIQKNSKLENIRIVQTSRGA